MTGRTVEPSVLRVFVAITLCGSLAACGADVRGAEGRVPLQRLLEDPASFADRRVEVTTGYYSSFEVSVLTSGFAESFPPQPVEPMVWVNAQPPSSCLEVEEHASWAEDVVATGVFETGGGFGHLGQYEFELTDPEITCG